MDGESKGRRDREKGIRGGAIMGREELRGESTGKQGRKGHKAR